jgi:LL-diaminopimelate aminotransferase
VSQFKPAKRVQAIPPYLFARIDAMKRDAISKGADIINLGIGDPDLPTPKHIIRALEKAANNPANHQYPAYQGSLEYRTAVADWYKKRFKINLNPNTDVLALIGSKEGIAHAALAFVDPGDVVLVPDPGYPVYHIGTTFAGGTTYRMPLKKENGFLPDFEKIPKSVLKRAKLMWLNYPNNPTGAAATLDFFNEAVRFAKKYNIIICHDFAYSEIYYDNISPPSFLNAKGAMDVGIEFHSLSKTYNMTGWRIGFASGHPELIASLGKIKNNLDSGVFGAIQQAGITALSGSQSTVEKLREIYQKRRDVLVKGLQKIGWEVFIPQGGFYVWITVPKEYSSMELTAKILQETGIVTTPGVGFGEYGEGYIRMTVTTTEDRLREAVRRLEKLKI